MVSEYLAFLGEEEDISIPRTCAPRKQQCLGFLRGAHFSGYAYRENVQSETVYANSIPSLWQFLPFFTEIAELRRAECSGRRARALRDKRYSVITAKCEITPRSSQLVTSYT